MRRNLGYIKVTLRYINIHKHELVKRLMGVCGGKERITDRCLNMIKIVYIHVTQMSVKPVIRHNYTF